jgi:hypothetical protein
MSKYYHPKHKALVLQKLVENNGDIILTSLQTGVPQRTLRDWRYQSHILTAAAVDEMAAARRTQESEPPPSASELDDDALKRIHDKLVADIHKLINTLGDDMEYASFPQRVTALARMVESLPKLQSLLTTDDDQFIRIQYQDADTGIVYNEPPWEEYDTED